ncbi:MAG: hypothetical protein E6J34_10185 [Chloroflexi bacterium]|nr:MAG: hypothetical protein E6J34_10185 [Chloroflexota bacterium]
MTYSRSNGIKEQEEACHKAQQITVACEQLHIRLDPIDWQQYGMQAPVKVKGTEIASLMNLSQCDPDGLLRQVQIKLLEHAALEAIHARPGLKAVMWSPVEVVQPQEFLSLWIITLETDERIPITESIRQGQRCYEYFTLNRDDEHQLAVLFGPASEGAYHLGESITIKDRERYYSGQILYVIPPGKIIPNRKSTSRGYHTIGGTAYRNDVAARYIIDCNDGFPHIVYQSQVIQ